MKWILIISLIQSGQSIELSRTNGTNPPLPTKEICETAGYYTLTLVLREYPDKVGKLFFRCEQQ